MLQIRNRIGETVRRVRGSIGHASRRRGSAVLLVVVSLVLMTLIGAAYLQQTRVQRFAVGDSPGCTDRVVEAIIDQISRTIKEDLPDDLSPEDGLALYDYPWTNVVDNGWVANNYDADGETVPGRFGDRPWLASHTPDYDSNGQDPIWPKITNLNGVFLDYDRHDDEFTPGSGTVPIAERLVNDPNNADHWDGDLPININGTTSGSGFLQLVDATGDGIPDSRWTWAPIRECSGITYVMAVRIIDLSGLLNVNTAMSLIDETGAFDADSEAPRWDTPSELDLGGFVFGLAHNTNLGLGGDTWQAEAMEDLDERLLDYRFAGNRTLGLPVDHSDRRSFWTDQGRYFSAQPDHGYFTRADEYELRHRFGLHSGRDRTVTGASTGLHGFLRGDVDAELAYGDFLPERGRYADEPSGMSPDDDWYFHHREPRKLLTTMSGAMPLVWPRTPEGGFNPDASKINVNSASVGAVAGRILGMLDDWDVDWSRTNNEVVLPGNYNFETEAEREAFAYQYAVNLRAYRESTTDGRMPRYDITADEEANLTFNEGDAFYGFKPLPILTEVYTQAKYEGDDPLQGDPTGNPSEFEWNIEWDRQDPVGFAIEVRNPYHVPVDLNTVHLVVAADGTEVDWGTVADLAERLGTTKATLGPGEVLIFYRNSHEGNWDSDDANRTRDDIGQIIDDAEAANSDPNLSVVKIEVPEGASAPSDPDNTSTEPLDWPEATAAVRQDDVMVSLRATIRPLDDSLAEYVADWSYSEFEGARYPQQQTTTFIAVDTGSGPDLGAESLASPQISYDQHTRHGGSRGLNILDVDPADPSNEQAKDLDGSGNDAWQQGSTGWHDDTIPQLAKEDKLNDTGTEVDEPELREEQQLIFRGESLQHTGEMLFVTPLDIYDAPTDPDASLMVKAWRARADDGGATRNVDNLLFNMVPGNNNLLIEDGSDYTIAPAALLVGQFSTISPEERETIPGLLNINTVPLHLLEEVLPIADNALRREVAQRIVAYRDGDETQRVALLNAIPGNSVTTDQVRANPGIAHIGELYPLLGDLFTGVPVSIVGGGPLQDTTGDTFEIAGPTNDVRIDFLANIDGEDGIADDREEEAMLFNWLTEVATTRSDYFAAYVVLRGYDSAGTFTDLDIRDSKRFIVLYRREVEDGDVKVVDVLPGNDVYEVQ